MSLSHVLLGLLSRAPGSGWDLRSRLARDGAVGWDADLAQIYPALRRLLRGRFVTAKKRKSEKGPPRKEYALTPAGRRELLQWLAEPVGPPRAKDPALARLAFLERLAPDVRLAHLATWRNHVAAALKAAGPGSTAARRRRRAILETELAWADAEVALLARQEETSRRREPPRPGSPGRA